LSFTSERRTRREVPFNGKKGVGFPGKGGGAWREVVFKKKGGWGKKKREKRSLPSRKRRKKAPRLTLRAREIG